jgi:hypothetical protein
MNTTTNTFTATFVPDPEKHSSEDIFQTLARAAEVAGTDSASRRTFQYGEATIVFSSVEAPAANFLVIRSQSPAETDRALEVLEGAFERASGEQLREAADAGNPLLWAVAEQGNPYPNELEAVLWEQLGSPEFEERLVASEAAWMLGSPGALLAIELCALVELGPIRAVFESHLAGSHRRSASREKRVLLDPAVPLQDALEVVHTRASTLPGASIDSCVGYASTYFQWRGETDRAYVIDADHPSVRWLGFDGPNTASLADLGSLTVLKALERAPENTDWLRAAANAIEPEDQAAFLETLDALEAAGVSTFEIAFAAIESAMPEAWNWLLERRSQFDERLEPIIDATSIAARARKCDDS